MGIYQIIHQAKFIPKKMTVPIQKIGDQDQTDEPVKKADKRRITESQQKKYKETRITTTLKVTNGLRSNSRVPDYEGEIYYSQPTFDDDLETFMMKKNNDLFGNAFND